MWRYLQGQLRHSHVEMLRYPQLKMLTFTFICLTSDIRFFSQVQDIDTDSYSAISDTLFFHIPLLIANRVGTTLEVSTVSLYPWLWLPAIFHLRMFKPLYRQARNAGGWFIAQEWSSTITRWNLGDKYPSCLTYQWLNLHSLPEGPHWLSLGCSQWQPLLFLEITAQIIYLYPNPVSDFHGNPN